MRSLNLCAAGLFWILPFAMATVRPCFTYDDGNKLRCIKEMSGNNGDNFGRVGIINKSKCESIRYVKQEWSVPCGTSTVVGSTDVVLRRVFPGEVLKFGLFQQDMVQDSVQLGTCGELRILDCTCEYEHVDCSDVLWAATYKRGEHAALLDKFHKSRQHQTSSRYFEFED